MLVDSSLSSRGRLLLGSVRSHNGRPDTRLCFSVCNDTEALTAGLSGTRGEFSSEVVLTAVAAPQSEHDKDRPGLAR
jgi:hypothetical protein